MEGILPRLPGDAMKFAVMIFRRTKLPPDAVFAERNSYDMVIILDSPWRRHPVWPDGGSVFAELHMSLYDPCRWECRQLLALDLAVLRTPQFF